MKKNVFFCIWLWDGRGNAIGHSGFFVLLCPRYSLSRLEVGTVTHLRMALWRWLIRDRESVDTNLKTCRFHVANLARTHL